MGSLFGRHWLSSGGAPTPPAPPPAASLPSPDDFEVVKAELIGMFWVASIRYPGALHYEGLKTIVLRKDPTTLVSLDPHFLPDHLLVARFEPGEVGYAVAKTFARMMNNGDLNSG